MISNNGHMKKVAKLENIMRICGFLLFQPKALGGDICFFWLCMMELAIEFIIPQEYYRAVLDARSSKVQNVQRQFNVTIKFPDREKPENADKSCLEDQPNTGRATSVVPGRRSRPTSATCIRLWRKTKQLPEGHETEDDQEQRGKKFHIIFDD
ncbi:hypothetical protein NPIL_278251 [Nephila pilipes]|uniref:Uncharacterized protein n=1 Tax=Nephila pilipes TaxID=299642 RepID=A0A8X6UJI3_NEPPI|nr:hypothetical protein NPIL_278251 [Nephila pilipes]